MSNMAYCRFQNTLSDLEDCAEHIQDDREDMSDEEEKARTELVEVCRRIIEDYDNK